MAQPIIIGHTSDDRPKAPYDRDTLPLRECCLCCKSLQDRKFVPFGILAFILSVLLSALSGAQLGDLKP